MRPSDRDATPSEAPPTPLASDEEAALVAAIRNAERDNRGEVRVHIERTCAGDPLKRAAKVFALLGMHGVEDGAGVLVYVAVDDRKVAVYAGPGVHDAGGESFWQGVADSVAYGFAAGSGGDGLCEAVGRIGELLRRVVGGDDYARFGPPRDLSVL